MADDKHGFDKSLKLIAKSSIIVFFGVVFSKVMSYVYRVVIARQFGPDTYGIFSLAVMLSGWFIIFSIMGLNQGLLRYIPIFRAKNEKGKIKYIIRKSLVFLLVSGAIFGLLFFLLSSFISIRIFNEPDLIMFLKIFSLAIPATILFMALLAILRGFERIGWSSFLSSIVSPFVKVMLIWILIIVGFGLNAVLYSYVFGVVLTLIVAFFIYRFTVVKVLGKEGGETKAEPGAFKEMLSYSWPFLFAGIIWRIFHWTDSFFIGVFQSAREVGIYNVALPIAMLLTISSQLFLSLFFPLVNREYSKGNKKTINQLSQQIGKWTLILNVPIFVILILFPDIVIQLLFGIEYLGAENAIRFLAVGILFLSLFEISNRLIATAGKSKTILYDILFVAFVNIILNIILIPRYGINGASISTMISFILLSVIFAAQSYKYLKIIPLRKKMVNVVVSGLVSSMILILLMKFITVNLKSSIALIIFFLGLYTLLIFILKGFDKNDIMVLRSFKRTLQN